MYKILANTLFTGQRLVFVPECHSTNSLASELASKTNLPEGTVVITSHQTAGRGQRGNTWETSSGMNLTFSVLMKPVFLSAKNQFSLTLITSLAIADFLKALAIEEVMIKWPNDILVGKKKICGVLIENSLQGEVIQQSIIGIGLNINQTEFSVSTATSLAIITGKKFDLNLQLNELLKNLELRYLQLRSGKSSVLKNEYVDNLFGRHELRTFLSHDRQFEGIIEDVNENGELIVSVDSKQINYSLKEINFLL